MVLMNSPDNPNRLCKPGSTCANTAVCLFWITIIIAFLVALYFMLIGLGYGMTSAVKGNEFNMTTGCRRDYIECTSKKIMCYYNDDVAFYGGCLFVGFFSALVLVVSGLIALFLINFIIIYCCDLKDNISAASKSAKALEQKNQPIEQITEQNSSVPLEEKSSDTIISLED
jgi:hypothetical protein